MHIHDTRGREAIPKVRSGLLPFRRGHFLLRHFYDRHFRRAVDLVATPSVRLVAIRVSVKKNNSPRIGNGGPSTT